MEETTVQGNDPAALLLIGAVVLLIAVVGGAALLRRRRSRQSRTARVDARLDVIACDFDRVAEYVGGPGKPEDWGSFELGLRHDQKPNWWMAKTLPEKLGLGTYYPWKDVEEYLSHRMTAAGLSWDQLQKDGIIRGP